MSGFSCPGCGASYDVIELELFEVYEEDGKETAFDCEACGTSLIVQSSIVEWSFEAVIDEG